MLDCLERVIVWQILIFNRFPKHFLHSLERFISVDPERWMILLLSRGNHVTAVLLVHHS